ncbi:MICOS complex subunit MIC60, mitochondrial-like [Raphanus sativus]|uniref:MICOS complex subunit MIC60, mitochondrial-like n=1 Tax=Raphanus sativus TaxID=3726 RepID=A0A9W3CIW9_RAPSA|nr:MICOS complex subunit MIC60, mitochondrial-like [Raphanus sativus]
MWTTRNGSNYIKALCMAAFYARSEEARQSHSVHKLALGALALEDTLSKGLPIQKEIDIISTYSIVAQVQGSGPI